MKKFIKKNKIKYFDKYFYIEKYIQQSINYFFSELSEKDKHDKLIEKIIFLEENLKEDSMKNMKILAISILFSFTAYSQTNKELAKEETIKMINDLKLTSDQYKALYNINLKIIIESNNFKLRLEERQKNIFKELLTPEQYSNYEGNKKLASKQINFKTTEEITAKEVAFLTNKLELDEKQIKYLYPIILGFVDKTQGMQSMGQDTKKVESVMTYIQEEKKSMFKDVLSPKQFTAYEDYIFTQDKINAALIEIMMAVPEEKESIRNEPVPFNNEIKN